MGRKGNNKIRKRKDTRRKIAGTRKDSKGKGHVKERTRKGVGKICKGKGKGKNRGPMERNVKEKCVGKGCYGNSLCQSILLNFV